MKFLSRFILVISFTVGFGQLTGMQPEPAVGKPQAAQLNALRHMKNKHAAYSIPKQYPL